MMAFDLIMSFFELMLKQGKELGKISLSLHLLASVQGKSQSFKDDRTSYVMIDGLISSPIGK
jgi:hypothetical protein